MHSRLMDRRLMSLQLNLRLLSWHDSLRHSPLLHSSHSSCFQPTYPGGHAVPESVSWRSSQALATNRATSASVSAVPSFHRSLLVPKYKSCLRKMRSDERANSLCSLRVHLILEYPLVLGAWNLGILYRRASLYG